MGGGTGLAGVIAALSVVSDLTRGHPPGEAMRACLLATELARRAGLDAGRRDEDREAQPSDAGHAAHDAGSVVMRS
jgi:hypothetical protein